MQLYHIETALQGQFVWHRPARKKFHTNAEIECSANTALIVFIGLANRNGFNEKAICDYLRIDPHLYHRLSGVYSTKMHEAAERISRQRWNYNRQDLVQRVWMKSALVNRNIMFQQGVIAISDLTLVRV